MRKYLVTGAGGFVGRHFLEYLSRVEPDCHVIAVDKATPPFRLPTKPRVTADCFDLQDTTATTEALRRHVPTHVLHLASFSSVAYSWENPDSSVRNNLNIFLNLLEAIRKDKIGCRVLSIGSSEQYGAASPSDLPLREDSPLKPSSPYAVARVCQEMMSRVYWTGYGIPIVMTRSFNHIGPGQREEFFVSSMVAQIVELRRGGRTSGEIRVGNTDVIRDFVDVRDVVAAYHGLLHRGEAGEVYNVCGGSPVRLADIVETIADLVGVDVVLRKDPDRLRPTDNEVIHGNNDKLRAALGWTPKIPMRQTVQDMVDDYRARSKAST